MGPWYLRTRRETRGVRSCPHGPLVVTVDGASAPFPSTAARRVRACHTHGYAVVCPGSSAPFQWFASPIGLVIGRRAMSPRVALVEAGISPQAWAATRGPSLHERGAHTARACAAFQPVLTRDKSRDIARRSLCAS